MGEARQRGTQQQRIAQAQADAGAAPAQPPVIRCNLCQAALPQVEPMDVQALKGLQLAYKAHCAACSRDTWAVRGEPAAVRAFYAALEKAAGQKVQLGSTQRTLHS